MLARNSNFQQLTKNYLFPQILAKKNEFLAKNPHAQLVSLGIGDTTEPLPRPIVEGLINASCALGTKEGYTGYGQEQGSELLREKIAETFYKKQIASNEIFISDGAKCDIGRLQLLFGGDVSVAIQDPAYPVYVEGSFLHGVKNIHFLPCLPENDFFPDLKKLEKIDLIYFCSPNNPTGAVATHSQLETLVAFAKEKRSLILFDAAYSQYIQDPNLPKSIYEIKDAKELAIEVNSFSKIAGFTGVRLGWTVVPHALKYRDGGSIHADWTRLITTLFNGASILSQKGGLAVLTKEGFLAVSNQGTFYMENARLLRTALKELGYEVYGGLHAPYLWVRFKNQTSWELFDQFLERYHLVTTPGSGFGMSGEGFLRMSAFGHRSSIEEAISRLKTL